MTTALTRRQRLAIGAHMSRWLPEGHALGPGTPARCGRMILGPELRSSGEPELVRCELPAVYCEYSSFQGPNGPSIAFHYFCPVCWQAPAANGGPSAEMRARKLPSGRSW